MIKSKNSNNEWVETDEMMFSCDVDATHSKNDVSIISKAAYQEAKMSQIKGYCHTRFQANLVVSMTRDEEERMKVTGKLDIEGVKLFLLHKKHRCHEQCPLYTLNRQPCEWTSHIYYAGIITGGKVNKGCIVVI